MNRFVLIVRPVLLKIQTGLLKLPNVLVPKLPRSFVIFTIFFTVLIYGKKQVDIPQLTNPYFIGVSI